MANATKSGRLTAKKRSKSLMTTADRIILRMEELSAPGNALDQMDIKELKTFVSSLKEMVSIGAELTGEGGQCGGVIFLPEVSEDA